MRTALLALAVVLTASGAGALDLTDSVTVSTGRVRAIGTTAEVLLQVRNAGTARVEVAEVSCAVTGRSGSPVGEASSIVRNIQPGQTVTARNLIGIADADSKALGAATCRIVDAR